ncbi:MAG: hypothetical protein MZU95_05945 [Desulfomicrobium escambiense]|nr:hypothetical protein [Desulfomicrobium escambiense]
MSGEGHWTRDQDKEEIGRLREQLSEAKRKELIGADGPSGKRESAFRHGKKLQKALPDETTVQPAGKSSELNKGANENRTGETRQEIGALRRKIEELKDEIRNQQESRRQLRQDLQTAHQKILRQNTEKAPTEAPAEEEPVYPAGIPEKVHVPEFTDAFRRSCEEIPPSLVIKAMHASVGFGARDGVILRRTAAIERLPGYYRIRIGVHHRLIVRQTPGHTLQILEVIPRKQLDTWIRQHAP